MLHQPQRTAFACSKRITANLFADLFSNLAFHRRENRFYIAFCCYQVCGYLCRASRRWTLCVLLACLSVPAITHATEPLLNVNVAPASELAKKLPGIGPAKAQAIVQYREQHGPFETVDSLVKVKGIGPGILAKIQALIIVGSGVGSGGDNNANQPLSTRTPAKTFAQQETAARHAVRAALTLAARHAAHARESSQLK